MQAMRPEPVALSSHKLVVVRMLVMVVILTMIIIAWSSPIGGRPPPLPCVDLIFLFFEGMEDKRLAGRMD